MTTHKISGDFKQNNTVQIIKHICLNAKRESIIIYLQHRKHMSRAIKILKREVK